MRGGGVDVGLDSAARAKNDAVLVVSPRSDESGPLFRPPHGATTPTLERVDDPLSANTGPHGHLFLARVSAKTTGASAGRFPCSLQAHQFTDDSELTLLDRLASPLIYLIRSAKFHETQDTSRLKMATPEIAHTDGARLSVLRGYDTSHLVVDEKWVKQKSGEVEFPKSKAIAEQEAIAEEGRTYHGYNAGSYYLPNDPAEHERLDHQHRMVRLIQQGKLGLAPVQNPKNVIDVCTGTGIWATEYASEHPDCTVLGSDLSAIQPREGVPNCSFIQHDVEKQDWDYGRQFDYAYFRYMVTCFDDMPAVLRKARDSLREGGYLEIFDTPIQALSLDGSIDGTALAEWGDVGRAAGRALGRDMAKPRQYKRWLEEAGFVDVVETIVAAPVNEWCRDEHQKEIGRFMFHDFYALIGGLKKLVLAAGYSSDAADDFLRRVRATIEDPNVHAYYEKYIVYGRKPRADEVPATLLTGEAQKESTEAAAADEKPSSLGGFIISSLVMCRDSTALRSGVSKIRPAQEAIVSERNKPPHGAAMHVYRAGQLSELGRRRKVVTSCVVATCAIFLAASTLACHIWHHTHPILSGTSMASEGTIQERQT
ncbi:TAM domain [Cordyceps militaris]|uniref:TAM domain n=1 Tax=Cordyceps militaris TaxID=73501 RepID=A0A2H4SLR7_CORMI|nr:TAM domain [Cordyceps militaris]